MKKVLSTDWSISQWYHISQDLILFCFNVPLTNESAVELSVFDDVAGCRCPMAISIWWSCTAVWQTWKLDPISFHPDTASTAVYARRAPAYELVLYHCACEKKWFISISSPILILTTVLGIPRHADAKNDFKNYQGSTTSHKNDNDLNLCRYLNPELPPMRELDSLYFLNRYTFVCATLFGRIKLN